VCIVPQAPTLFWQGFQPRSHPTRPTIQRAHSIEQQQGPGPTTGTAPVLQRVRFRDEFNRQLAGGGGIPKAGMASFDDDRAI